MSLIDWWNWIKEQQQYNPEYYPYNGTHTDRDLPLTRSQMLLDKYGSDTYSELVGYDASVPGSDAPSYTHHSGSFSNLPVAAAQPVSYIAGGNSAGFVDQNSSEESLFGQYDRYMEFLKELSESQTAQSIELADRQNAWQAEQNKIAMDFSSLEAQQLRDWQTYMSNTAHQREVEDLKAAGLNPILSASGSGAPIGSAQAASGVTSSGARGQVSQTYSNAAVNFLSNTMNIAAQLQMSANSAAAAMASKEYDWQKKFEFADAYPTNGWRIFDSVMNEVAKANGYDNWTRFVGKLISRI